MERAELKLQVRMVSFARGNLKQVKGSPEEVKLYWKHKHKQKQKRQASRTTRARFSPY